MREIKFRAWDTEKKSMGLPFDFNVEMKTAPGIENCYDKFPYSTIFMQYTGLKDKNGVEIYEGDIVKGILGWDGYEGVGFIDYADWWDNGKDYDYWAGGNGWHIKTQECCQPINNYTGSKMYEVIGNIYENPELLEE